MQNLIPNIKFSPFNTFITFLFCWCLVGNTNVIWAQETTIIETGPTLFKNFQRPDILKMTLTTATKQLVGKKFKEEWQPITLNFQDSSGMDIEWDAKVRTRGNIRKQVCYYPPLKLKFKKKYPKCYQTFQLGSPAELVFFFAVCSFPQLDCQKKV